MPASATPAVSALTAIQLVPASRFFLRVIPLDPASDPAAQVELYFERTAPFPHTQLAAGFLLSPSGRQALVYAAHRPRLENELPAGWTEAVAVLPDVVALAVAAETAAQTRAHEFDGGGWIAEWDAAAGWLSDLRAAGTGRDATGPVGRGAASARLRGDAVELLLPGDGETAPAAAGRLAGARLRHADVRGAAEVAAVWRSRRQGRWLARVAAVGLAALVALAGGEAALRLARMHAAGAVPETLLTEASAWGEVADIAEFLARGGPGPVDALARVNLARPAGVTFFRVVAQSGRLTCEGVAPDEATWQAFVAKVRAMSGVTQVDVTGAAERFTLAVQMEGGAAAREGSP